MTDHVDVGSVLRHAFYSVFAYDPDISGESDAVFDRRVTQIEYGSDQDLTGMEVRVRGDALPPWLYCPLLFRVFNTEARQVIDEALEIGDRIRFHTCPALLSDGGVSEVHVALPSDTVNVLSPRSTIAPHGVAMWWALELSKLRDRTMFIVPHATTTTAMRGDLIIALHRLGWPGYVRPLRVMDGDHMVSYLDWANHPEWTGYVAQ